MAEAGSAVGAQDELLFEPEPPAAPPPTTPVAVDEALALEATALETLVADMDMLLEADEAKPEADEAMLDAEDTTMLEADDAMLEALETGASDEDGVPLAVAEATWPERSVAKEGSADAAEKTPVVTGPRSELAAGAA